MAGCAQGTSVAGKAVAGFSDDGCVSGKWFYEKSDGSMEGPYTGCTEEFDDKPWCATKTVTKDGREVYVSGSKEGTKWKHCGEEATGQELVFVGSNDIEKKLGTHTYAKTDSAAQVCKAMGYPGCFSGQMHNWRNYYESKDGSCTFSQIQLREVKTVDCGISPSFSWAKCEKYDWKNAREPEVGDTKEFTELIDVTCIK